MTKKLSAFVGVVQYFYRFYRYVNHTILNTYDDQFSFNWVKHILLGKGNIYTGSNVNVLCVCTLPNNILD